jgi:hypothetical protein
MAERVNFERRLKAFRLLVFAFLTGGTAAIGYAFGRSLGG